MSSLSKQVEVLVVGAGPAGLLTALELSRAGIEVEIIDRAWRTAAQSYACGLHPATLDLLSREGLNGSLFQEGLRAESVAFYEGTERRAEIRLADMHAPHPYLLVLPQFELEEVLEDELRNRGVSVRWGHRLDDLRQDANEVTATVEQLVLTSVGYPFARSEEVVERDLEVHAKYVVGADGSHSHVRHLLRIPVERLGPPSVYEVFEFEPAALVGAEVRMAVAPGSIDAFWPQPGCLCRWSLEMGATAAGHPDKERHAIVVQGPSGESKISEELNTRFRERAPWFDSGVKELVWTTRVAFDRMWATEYGRDRCWLVGDAGHQTSPAGMQSMNVGLREAVELANGLRRVLRESGSTEILRAYGAARCAEWRQIHDTKDSVRVRPKATAWVRNHRQRLVACLPGSGPELTAMASQIGLEWP